MRKSVELVHSIQEIKPVCAPGTIPINFLCTPCFDVALVEGAEVRFSDLPQAHEEGNRWEWLYGCRWQCLHADDLWEMRAAIGSYWECKTPAERDSLLNLDDLSWLGLRRSLLSSDSRAGVPHSGEVADEKEAYSTLPGSAAIVGVLPVAALVCAVLVSFWRMCYARKRENLKQCGGLLAGGRAV
jgi:hypothetical protein